MQKDEATMMDLGANDVFNALYKKHYKQVYYYAYSILRDHFLAQDAVQETFIKIFRRFNALKVDDIQEAWLNVISRNTAIDLYRKRMRSQDSRTTAWRSSRVPSTGA